MAGSLISSESLAYSRPRLRAAQTAGGAWISPGKAAPGPSSKRRRPGPRTLYRCSCRRDRIYFSVSNASSHVMKMSAVVTNFQARIEGHMRSKSDRQSSQINTVAVESITAVDHRRNALPSSRLCTTGLSNSAIGSRPRPRWSKTRHRRCGSPATISLHRISADARSSKISQVGWPAAPVTGTSLAACSMNTATSASVSRRFHSGGLRFGS
jgi:hypothetical protein